VLLEERNALVEIDIPLVFTANHYFFKSSVLREPTDEYCPYLFAPCDCSRTKIVRHGQTSLQSMYATGPRQTYVTRMSMTSEIYSLLK
jgi:hypothetical protein